MRVGFIARSTIFSSPGGDTFQMVETARQLRLCGVAVDIRKSNEKIDHRLYDLFHFFNIIRPADAIKLSKAGIPYVFSPIYIDYSDFDKKVRFGLAKYIFRFCSNDGIEYLKTVARFINKNDRINSWTYLWKGQKQSIEHLLNNAALLLPATNSEYELLKKHYTFKNSYKVIPLGINEQLFYSTNKTKKDPSLVLCVGRIEGIKNQLQLIRALKNTSYRLLLVGSAAPNQIAYYNQCVKELGVNMRIINYLPQSELATYYSAAKVHIQPSLFENIGLANMEAAAMNCSIVATKKGFISEYLQDDSIYCDPLSQRSIYQAIDMAAQAPDNYTLSERIRKNYTWEQAALKTLNAYQTVLNTKA